MFPLQESLFEPVLRYIAERDGSIRFSIQGSDLESHLADMFGLTEAERTATSNRVNAKGGREWRNHIQWSRAKLIKRGFLDNSQGDHWAITDSGLRHIGETREGVDRLTERRRIEIALRGLTEGGIREVHLTRIERRPEVREECLKYYGPTCVVCRYNFKRKFGPQAEFLVHVHHLTPIAKAKSVRNVDPVRDCRPVCPNCHAVIHMNGGTKSIDEVKALQRLQGMSRKRRNRVL